MTNPLQTIIDAITSFQTGGDLTLPETILATAWTAMGFDPVSCPGNPKPFDTSTSDDEDAITLLVKKCPTPLRPYVDALLHEGERHDGAELWIASMAMAYVAEMHAQCCEDLI